MPTISKLCSDETSKKVDEQKAHSKSSGVERTEEFFLVWFKVGEKGNRYIKIIFQANVSVSGSS